MKKFVGVFVIASIFNIGYLNYTKAQEELQCENINGHKVCFAKEIMGELVKEAIYHVGSKALDKMKSDTNNSNSSSTSSNANNSNYNNYVDNSSNSNNSDVQEEMIPI